jgi:L-threonylcarbamoyladenylate synthase
MARLITVSASQPDASAIAEASLALQEGRLVAFPTETVYGLGADATSDKAVAGIFAAKGRPSFNPLIAHVAHTDQLHGHVMMDERAQELALAFWPGPLTLVLPRLAASGISLLCSAGLDCLAVRIPSHPVAQALLKKTERPIAAPSANRSGRISSTTPVHVMDELGEAIDLVLGAGRCPIGLESTILDLTGPATLLRHGGIPREQIEELIGPLAIPEKNAAQPKAPGQLESHYAPRAQVRLDAREARADEALLAFGPEMGISSGKTRLNLSPNGDINEAAANLFAMLHALDRPDITAIAVMPIPEAGLGLAINDRLRRAAAPRQLP